MGGEEPWCLAFLSRRLAGEAWTKWGWRLRIRKELLDFVLFCFALSFVFLGPHLQHMEVPRLGVQSKL